MNRENFKNIKIAIVGPCSSGKSTLKKRLLSEGFFNIRNPTQEHSYVPDMWQRISNPDLLIYLDVDYSTTLKRRPHIDLGPQRVERQNERLSHAREHADFYIDTSSHTPEEIQAKVLSFLDGVRER